MPIYQAPLNDMRFLLHDVLQIEKYDNLPGFSDAPRDIINAILEEGAKFAQEVLQPLNQVGDKEGCTRHDDGTVSPPTGFKEAYGLLVESGWPGLTSDPNFGGQGLPRVLGNAFSEMTSSANMAFGMYPGLSHGAYAAIQNHGTDEQKDFYLPKLVSGEWTGTMNLTEPHCGTDLGLMRTKAVPQADGSYKITGTKIFISAGEHDMAENIIHLVLARIEGAPEGISGVSLFIVPRNHIDADGTIGARNNVSCGAIEEKMGIHGNVTSVLNYEGSVGYLIGEENKGMRAMFTMMNEARLGVGLQGLSQSEVAYQNAVAYANDRLQGRSLTGPKNADGPADPIIVHPDVRRMLMDHKSFNEAARAFVYWTALWGDIEERSQDESECEKGSDYMALLTPVIKGYLTDKGFDHCVNAQQVYGGHGYIAEWGMDQFVRDARIAMIYEGANGVQALDLVGRKLAMKGMRPITTYMAELRTFVEDRAEIVEMAPFVKAVDTACDCLEEATNWFMNNALENLDHAGAGSMDYLHLFGIAALTHMWALMAETAHAKLGQGDGDTSFYDAKIKTGIYFVERVLPDIHAHLAKMKTGADPVMALTAEQF